jgi:hypothetical protein
MLNELKSLSESYKRVELELYKTLRLDQISLPNNLERFLHDPQEQLKRELFDPLFGLLKKNNLETFEKESLEKVEFSLRNLYPLAYEKWIELSIVKLLDPKKVFDVPLYRYTPTEIMKRCPSIVKEPIPPPEASTYLFLERESVPTLIVPDFIIYSTKLSQFVAFKSKLKPAFWIALNPPDEREYVLIECIKEKIYPKPTLTIYVDEKLENLCLIADATRIYKPDLVVNAYIGVEQIELRKIKTYHEILKPKMGTFVVSKEPLSEYLCKELKEANIYFLAADFECSKLNAIVTHIENCVRAGG